MLQQYLPFTVLKLKFKQSSNNSLLFSLQQYLPFTVLKLSAPDYRGASNKYVATVPTVYGIETLQVVEFQE